MLSPSLELDLPPLHKKIQRIAPIVRPGLRSAAEVKHDRAIIMLSGSSLGTQPKLSETGFGMQVDVVGRGEPEGNNRDKSGIKFVGRTADSIRYINKANFAVVNGGFSAVSEMFVRRCPMVVVPVPGHSEQYVNAKTIERLGVGLIAEENELEEKLKRLIEIGDEFTHSYSKFDAAGDGASLAAKSKSLSDELINQQYRFSNTVVCQFLWLQTGLFFSLSNGVPSTISQPCSRISGGLTSFLVNGFWSFRLNNKPPMEPRSAVHHLIMSFILAYVI